MRALKEGVPLFGVNIVKIARDGSSVSFLYYPRFDSTPHPQLLRSIHVPLDQSKKITRRRYKDNPPVIHRKEEFILASYPRFAAFRRLTRAEEEAGLLKRTPGFQRQWDERLKNEGYVIQGHRLLKKML